MKPTKVDTYRILSWMGNCVIAIAVPVLGLWVGGFSITAKTGAAPSGIWWTVVPSVGVGVVGVCSLAIMAAMVATVDMARGPRILVGMLGFTGLAANVVNLPFYMIAAGEPEIKTIPQAIEWVFGRDTNVGIWTYVVYMLWFAATETGLAGVVTVRLSGEKRQKQVVDFEADREVATRRRVVGEIDEVVLSLLRVTDQTVNMLHEDLKENGYERHHVQSAVNRLVEKGVVSKEKRSGREYWYATIPEVGK